MDQLDSQQGGIVGPADRTHLLGRIEATAVTGVNGRAELSNDRDQKGGKAMLHYEALRQLTHERRLERECEAQAERLALQARGRLNRHARRKTLAARLERLLTAPRHATQQ